MARSTRRRKTYRQLQAEAKRLGVAANGTRASLMRRIAAAKKRRGRPTSARRAATRRPRRNAGGVWYIVYVTGGTVASGRGRYDYRTRKEADEQARKARIQGYSARVRREQASTPARTRAPARRNPRRGVQAGPNVRLTVKKNREWDEWMAVWYDGRVKNEAKTYYTGDGDAEAKEDAINTAKEMARRAGIPLSRVSWPGKPKAAPRQERPNPDYLPPRPGRVPPDHLRRARKWIRTQPVGELAFIGDGIEGTGLSAPQWRRAMRYLDQATGEVTEYTGELFKVEPRDVPPPRRKARSAPRKRTRTSSEVPPRRVPARRRNFRRKVMIILRGMRVGETISEYRLLQHVRLGPHPGGAKAFRERRAQLQAVLRAAIQHGLLRKAGTQYRRLDQRIAANKSFVAARRRAKARPNSPSRGQQVAKAETRGGAHRIVVRKHAPNDYSIEQYDRKAGRMVSQARSVGMTLKQARDKFWGLIHSASLHDNINYVKHTGWAARYGLLWRSEDAAGSSNRRRR